MTKMLSPRHCEAGNWGLEPWRQGGAEKELGRAPGSSQPCGLR